MKWTNIKYFIREGVRSFFVNWTMSLACVVVFSACLMSFGMYLSVGVNLNQAIGVARNEYTVRFYISRETSEKRVKEIGREIETLNGVSKVEYISKDEGLKIVVPEGNTGLEDSGDNPLPDVYGVTFSSLDTAKTVVAEVMKIPEIYKNSEKDTIEKLSKFTGKIQIFLLLLTAVMISVSIFIISNTIKLTVFARRRDINIMKFVGATDWFIRWPFIIEGIVIGLCGAIVSFGIMWYGYGYVSVAIASLFTNLDLNTYILPISQFAPLLLETFIGFAVLVGGTGSVISVRRHLHV